MFCRVCAACQWLKQFDVIIYSSSETLVPLKVLPWTCPGYHFLHLFLCIDRQRRLLVFSPHLTLLTLFTGWSLYSLVVCVEWSCCNLLVFVITYYCSASCGPASHSSMIQLYALYIIQKGAPSTHELVLVPLLLDLVRADFYRRTFCLSKIVI